MATPAYRQQSLNWQHEAIETLKIAWPLIAAQIAGILMFTTDVVMMGWLGPSYLAAGSLATALLHPVLIMGVGLVSASAALVAQAIGGKKRKNVRRVTRQAIWLSIIIGVLVLPILWNATPIFLTLGQIPSIVTDAQSYLNIAALSLVFGYVTTACRSLFQAHDESRIILVISIIGVLLNIVSNYTLMFGNFGFPRFELVGAAISTLWVSAFMTLLSLWVIVKHKKTRRYYVLARFFKADWPRLWEIVRIGTPIGLTLLAEVGLFGFAVIMMGWISEDAVAGHAIAIQVAAIIFMVPLGLSFATIVRVGFAVGAKDEPGIARASWTSLGMTIGLMCVTCALLLIFPAQLASIFLDPARPENQAAIVLATGFVVVAGFFQMADGVQVSAAACLRGMNDTKMPMIIALFGYWIVGVGIALWLGFGLGLEGLGIWWGLAAGLTFVAVGNMVRFMMRDKLGLVQRAFKQVEQAG